MPRIVFPLTILRKLDAANALRRHVSTLQWVGKRPQSKADEYLLLSYRAKDANLFVRAFSVPMSQEANQAYTDAEKNKQQGDSVVLVRVGSLKNLTRAYPNFFLDTQMFSNMLRAIRTSPVLPAASSTKAS